MYRMWSTGFYNTDDNKRDQRTWVDVSKWDMESVHEREKWRTWRTQRESWTNIYISTGYLLFLNLNTHVNVDLKEGGDGWDSVFLVGKEKEEEESDELHFWFFYIWKYY